MKSCTREGKQMLDELQGVEFVIFLRIFIQEALSFQCRRFEFIHQGGIFVKSQRNLHLSDRGLSVSAFVPLFVIYPRTMYGYVCHKKY